MRAGNFVLSAIGRRYHWAGAERLSIKTFRCGTALYDIGSGRYRVHAGGYLIVNEGQPYEITIDSQRPVESFCVFFDPGVAEDVHRSLAWNDSALLDDPDGSIEPVRFIERVHPDDDLVTPQLERLRRAPVYRRGDRAWLDERARELAGGLLAAHRRERARSDRLDAIRQATRLELYRRIQRAREFARASLDKRLELKDLAGVACMSPAHFLRTFRRGFGVTPHAFLTRERLNAASRLLETTGSPVTDICFAVGFESLGSFSWAFRRRFGLSPMAWREAARKKHSGRSAGVRSPETLLS
jgi:AraC family transcriptional regulator